MHPKEISQKLFDNTIEDAEIDKLTESFSKDSYFSNDLFLNYLTPLFAKDTSKTLVALENIIRRIPSFSSQYVKFCLNFDIEYMYCNLDNKYDICGQLIKMLHIFIENKYTTIENIVELLDNSKNTELNIFFANDVINEFPQINDIAPQIVERIRNYKIESEKLFEKPEIIKDVAWPSVIYGDTNNPRISKFGGVQPFLPEEGYTLCHGCQSNCSMICQIYIPTTPEWFQNQFPPKYRDSLIVIFYCNSCYLHVEAKFYTSDQLDSLVYVNDIVYNGNYTFNEPRIVTGWTSGKMAPNNSNYIIIKEIANRYFNKSEKFKEYFSKFNFLHGPKGNDLTYIGGWPEFTQDDCTPDDSFFIINLSQSCSSTAMWGDAGTAQVWMKNPIGDYFGDLIGEWACC